MSRDELSNVMGVEQDENSSAKDRLGEQKKRRKGKGAA
jgi:hypothetical protein